MLVPFLPVLLLLLPLRSSLAALSIQQRGGDLLTLGPVRSDIAWLTDIKLSNITLVNLVRDRALFDYCDLTQYTPLGVAALLDAHQVKNNTQWAATLMWRDPVEDMARLCSQSVNLHDSYLLFYNQITAFYIQRAGAAAIIRQAINSVPQKYFSFDEMDKAAQTVLGERIQTCLTTITAHSSVDRLVDLLDEAQRENISLVATSLTVDFDRMDEAMDKPFSLFRVSQYALVPLTLYCLGHSVAVTTKYYHIKDRSLPPSYCSFSLIINVVANIMRAIRTIDTAGFQGTIPYFYARVIFTAPFCLGLCSALSTYFFWEEAVIHIQSSLDLRTAVVGKERKVAVVVISVLFIFVDLYISVRSVYGTLFGNITLIPAIALLVSSLCTGIAILISTRQLRKVIKKLRSSIRPAGHSEAAGGATLGTTIKSSDVASVPPSKSVVAWPNRNNVGDGNKESQLPSSTPPSNQNGHIDALKYNLLNKMEAAEMWMSRCGAAVLVLAASYAIVGLNVQYEGPSHLALMILPGALDQITSYFEMRVISVSIGTGKVETKK
jgi:hypothetical protein